MSSAIRLDQMRHHIKPYGNKGAERLLADMMARAATNASYGVALHKWINAGSTIALRELCKPFGNYWKNLAFANAVDVIDSAFLRVSTPPTSQ